jgi:hypothetical protein
MEPVPDVQVQLPSDEWSLASLQVERKMQWHSDVTTADRDRRRGRGPTARGAFRQGDVLLLPCGRIPAAARAEPPEDGLVVLARGEVTGHAHVMAAERVCRFREDGTGRGYVRVGGDAPSALTHEEHEALMVPPGDYRVVRQREYQPRSLPRAVAD